MTEIQLERITQGAVSLKFTRFFPVQIIKSLSQIDGASYAHAHARRVATRNGGQPLRKWYKIYQLRSHFTS